MNTLDEWEAEAKDYADTLARVIQPENHIVKMNTRIIVLINLIRKKDEVLEKIKFLVSDKKADSMEILMDRGIIKNKCSKALALTEELK